MIGTRGFSPTRTLHLHLGLNRNWPSLDPRGYRPERLVDRLSVAPGSFAVCRLVLVSLTIRISALPICACCNCLWQSGSRSIPLLESNRFPLFLLALPERCVEITGGTYGKKFGDDR